MQLTKPNSQKESIQHENPPLILIISHVPHPIEYIYANTNRIPQHRGEKHEKTERKKEGERKGKGRAINLKIGTKKGEERIGGEGIGHRGHCGRHEDVACCGRHYRATVVGRVAGESVYL